MYAYFLKSCLGNYFTNYLGTKAQLLRLGFFKVQMASLHIFILTVLNTQKRSTTHKLN